MPFEKGKSGNARGRPVGAKGKLSDRELANMLAKGTEDVLTFLMSLIKNEKENINARLKAACKWVDLDNEQRDKVYKRLQERLAEEESSQGKDDDDIAPVVKLTFSK